MSKVQQETEESIIKPTKKKKKANYHSIFSQASDAIYICDIAGNFLDVNDSFCRMFGYTPAEFKELTILDLMEPEELKARPIAFAHVARGERLFGERRMITKDRLVRVMEINIKMYEENCVLAIARDVTELRNTQKQISESEARFRAAFEHAAIGMALVSVDGNCLKVNGELCKMIGYDEDELASLSFQQFTHPDDLSRDLHLFQKALNGDITNYRMEKRYFAKDGSVVWVNLNATLVRDSHSKPLYFVSQIENISERKKSEEALRKSEANLQAIFYTTDTAYTLVDKKLTIIAHNKCAADFAREEIGVTGHVGDKLSDFFREDRTPMIASAIPRVLEGQNVSYETSYPQADGSLHWYYIRLYPIKGAEPEIFGLMLAIDNITKRKRDELERERIATDLISRNKGLEEFTHILSHNVRSHVARLMGLTDLLTDHDISSHENRELISGISQSSRSLDEVVRTLNDILQFKN